MRIPRSGWRSESPRGVRNPSDVNPDESGISHTPRAERRPVRINGVARLSNYSVVPITVVNLSYDGCRIETQAQLLPGDRIQITLKGSVANAKVCWVTDGFAGLSFTSQSPFETKTTFENDARATKRLETKISATMQRHGQVKYAVSVSDMSPSGCKVEFVDRPEIDERVHMRFQGLEAIEGIVRWIADHHAGVYFEKQIHPAVFEQLIERSARPG